MLVVTLLRTSRMITILCTDACAKCGELIWPQHTYTHGKGKQIPKSLTQVLSTVI